MCKIPLLASFRLYWTQVSSSYYAWFLCFPVHLAHEFIFLPVCYTHQKSLLFVLLPVLFFQVFLHI